MLESEKITDLQKLARIKKKIARIEPSRVDHVSRKTKNEHNYFIEINSYEKGEMTLAQLQNILIGSGSDSHTDNVIAQINPDRFEFYVFQAQYENDQHYHGQHYEFYEFEF